MSVLSMRLAMSRKSKLMTKDKYDRIVSFLLDPATCTDAHLRHWVKMRRFSLQQSAISNADEQMQALSASISVSRY